MMERLRPVCRVATGVLFVIAGIGHLVVPDKLVVIIPPYLSHPRLIVLVSGLLEIAGGLGLLWTRMARKAALGLGLLLMSFLPANIHMAVNGAQIPGWEMPAWVLWARLPGLLVFLAWFHWCTLDTRSPGASPGA
ncbi:MAG: DoxX family membrane protein [Candidatus Riflebacteria bacterium]|nr:DoxX family membrane protein [Candidatus Riflebacteria bacterium]